MLWLVDAFASNAEAGSKEARNEIYLVAVGGHDHRCPVGGSQCGHILGVFKNWYPLSVLMGLYVFKTFQHFVPLDIKAAVSKVVVR
jgi:hypothetical protein